MATTSFQGKRVSAEWGIILRAATAAGVRFTLNSGNRTMGEQAALFRQNMFPNGTRRPGRPLTARPNPNAPHIRAGRIDHALDVDSLNGGEARLQRWLEKQGARVGNPVSGEAWHMEVPAEDLRRLAAKLRPKTRLEKWRIELEHLRSMKPNTKRRARIAELVRAIKRERK